MKLNIKAVDRIVGIFILLAILSLVAILIFLGLNQRWFKKNFYYYSYFKSATNLSKGMSITLSGVEIGKVSHIALEPENKNVRVDFYIYEEYYKTTVFFHSIIELVSSPIGLGSGLVFHPGKDTSATIEEGTLIPTYNSDLGLRYVNDGLVERAPTDDSIGALIAQINPIIQRIEPLLFTSHNVLKEVEKAMQGTRATELGQILYDLDNLVLTVDKSLSDLDTILLGNDTGPIGNTLANLSEASEGAGEIVANINDVVEEVDITVQRERGKIEEMITQLQGSLAKVDSVIGNVDDLTADPTGLVVRLLDPQGSLKTLLDDENELFERITAMLDEVDGAVTELKNFAQFVTSTAPQLSGILDEGKATLDMGQDVLEGLKNNPLLRSGISEKSEQEATTGSYRDTEF